MFWSSRPTRLPHLAGTFAVVVAAGLMGLFPAFAQPASQAQVRPAQSGPGPDVATLRDLVALLDSLDSHPALLAAARAVDAARADLEQVRFPLTVEGEVAARRFDITAIAAPGVPQRSVDEAVDEARWNLSASVRARLRPFRVGDLGDLDAQRQLALAQAVRRLRWTRATLESSAVRAAAGLHLAERAVAIAEAGVALADEAAAATGLRVERGAAHAREAERAALEQRRSRERLRVATSASERALRRLADLVGAGRTIRTVPDPAALQALNGSATTDPNVLAAEDEVTLAAIAVAAAERALLPTAQASYAWSTTDGAVSVSIESRTLQPTVAYDTPNPYAGVADAIGVPDGTLAEPPTIDGNLTLALSYAFGGQAAFGADAAAARLEAARSRLVAARSEAQRADDERAEAIRAARAAAAFAREELGFARAEADDVRRRFELGVASPLEALQADLAALESDLNALRAEVDLLGAVLDTYSALAVPLSEVLP